MNDEDNGGLLLLILGFAVFGIGMFLGHGLATGAKAAEIARIRSSVNQSQPEYI